MGNFWAQTKIAKVSLESKSNFENCILDSDDHFAVQVRNGAVHDWSWSPSFDAPVASALLETLLPIFYLLLLIFRSLTASVGSVGSVTFTSHFQKVEPC